VQVWPAVLDSLRQKSPALTATFEGARPVSLEEGTLKIGFPVAATFNKRKAEAPDKRELMADALEAVTGGKLRPVYVLLDGEDAPQQPAEEAEVDHDELLDRLKREFNAEEVG
jgi:hypothetical protein